MSSMLHGVLILVLGLLFYNLFIILYHNIFMSLMTIMMILNNLLHPLHQVWISEAFILFLVHYLYYLFHQDYCDDFSGLISHKLQLILFMPYHQSFYFNYW